ncbi:MAG: MMPL family transporter, partial [Anderseniella sp.]
YEKNMASLSSVSGEDKSAHSQTRTIATIFVLVLAVAALFLFPQARFDGDPINLKDPEAPTVQAFLEILKDQPGEVYSGQVLVEPGQAALDMIAKLKTLPAVKKIHYIEDFLPKDQDIKLGDLNSLNEFVPRVVKSGTDIGEVVRERMLGSIATNMKAMSDVSDAPEALKTSAIRLQKAITEFEAQSAGKPENAKALEEDLFVKLPDMLAEINKLASINAVSVDSLQKNLRERFVAPDGRWRLEVVPAKDMRNSENLKDFVNQLQSVDPTASGSPMDIAGSSEAVAKSMIYATLAALFMVAILSWLALRRMLDVALVLSPLVLAACLMVGYTVAFDSPFNFANVIVLPLLLGLGVDSSIHYVMRAREETVATDVTGTSTPRAVLISALTTVGSFGTLWLSGHRGMSSMGELLTIAILVTLICTLVVLPQLMHWVSSRARS